MEKKIRSVKFNMVMNAILTMSNIIFPLITFPYVSRILLPEGMGKLSFVTSVVGYFSMFAQLGIPTYGIRTCARIRDDKEKLSRTVQELLILNFITVIVSYVVFAISIVAIPRFSREKELFIITGITILLNAMGVEWLYKALEQYAYITVRSVIFKIIAVAGMFLLIHNKEDYILYGAISIFAASASNILNFINLRKHICIKPAGGYEIKKHIKPMLVFFSVSVAAAIYTNLDNVMLGFMNTDVEVGYYSGAIKVKTILVSLVTSASVVLLPRASHYIEKGEKEEFYKILNKTMRFIMLIAIPFTIYFMIYARDSILLLSGPEFEGSIIPMVIIMPTLLFIGMSNLVGIQMLVPLGREKQVFWSEVYGAVVDFAINLALIPKYGAMGAAIGTVVAEMVVVAVQLCYVKSDVKNIFAGVSWLKILISNFLGLVSSIWILFMGWNAFITILVSGLLYFSVYGIMLLVSKEKLTLELVQGIMKR